MDGYSVVEQNNSQKFLVLLDFCPATYPTIVLNFFFNRKMECLFNPFYPNFFPVRSFSCECEVVCELHSKFSVSTKNPLQLLHARKIRCYQLSFRFVNVRHGVTAIDKCRLVEVIVTKLNRPADVIGGIIT